MKYLMLIYWDESAADFSPESMVPWEEYHAALTNARVLLDGLPIQFQETARTLRLSGGRPAVTDGPYAETKEQLGGYYVLECGDMEEALEWAAKLPAARQGGAIEVRPLLEC